MCDSYDAMTSDRPYRRAMSVEAARQELQAGAGTQFDPEVVAAFLRLTGSGPDRRAAPAATNVPGRALSGLSSGG